MGIYLHSNESKRNTNIFIEIPYRNNRIKETPLNSFDNNIKLCIASEIAGKMKLLLQKQVVYGKKRSIDFHK